jgi:hypothetical protein
VAGDHAVFVGLGAPDAADGLEQLRDALVGVARADEDGDAVAAARRWAARFTWARTAAETLAVYEASVA